MKVNSDFIPKLTAKRANVKQIFARVFDRKHCSLMLLLLGIVAIGWTGSLEANLNLQSGNTASVQEDAEMLARLQKLSALIEHNGASEESLSQRGDLYFFTGQFEKAASDYSEMVKLNPQLDHSHWRLGIAYFYAKEPEKAAAQFDKYHSFDDVDRENGIWRYFSHYRAYGKESAQKQLLKYEKDDREPFGDIYRLFQGDLAADEILRLINAAKITQQERDKRLFYAELYLGLNDTLEGREESAKIHLERAVANPWGQKAGYGPHYMYQVGKQQLRLITTPTGR
ncbi:tetratricopeptide repeat protein [Planctomicrobium sp. SH668]|uniref:tetratricopeptide repeat protein n=1 Tax=Planctomicrobium sp. SH668 TaxID=3448126 RepID=UPI003F5BD4BA